MNVLNVANSVRARTKVMSIFCLKGKIQSSDRISKAEQIWVAKPPFFSLSVCVFMIEHFVVYNDDEHSNVNISNVVIE